MALSLASRTKAFAVRIIRLYASLPKDKLDETLYWLELLVETEIVPAKRLAPLMQEIFRVPCSSFRVQ